MRIDEIIINIPIKIDLDGDKPKVNVAGNDALAQDSVAMAPVNPKPKMPNSVAMAPVNPKPKMPKVDNSDNDDEEFDQNPVMINPQQQELELKKAEMGKKSPSIDKMLDDDDEGEEESTDKDDSVENLRTLAGLNK